MKSSTLIMATILVAQAFLIMGVFAAVSIENSTFIMLAVGAYANDGCLIFSNPVLLILWTHITVEASSEILTDLDESVRRLCRCGGGGEGHHGPWQRQSY